MTEELYYMDAYQRRFNAEVTGKMQAEHGIGITLDRTCFYPTVGGQPADTGTLNSVRVIDMFHQEGEIVHVCETEVDGPVIGEIDWEKRFDHMQQHTGQHILSQALLQIARAHTNSFYLGSKTSSIDLHVAGLDQSTLDRAESLANRMVWENSRVHSYFVKYEEARGLELRGTPPKMDRVRVIEVEGFDLVACGGTHVQATGEVGPIKIIGLEQHPGSARLNFLCGKRAFDDYHQKHDLVIQLVNLFSASQSELGLRAARLMKDNEAKQKQLQKLKEQLLDLESSNLLDEAQLFHGARIIFRIFEERPLEEVRRLVEKVRRHDSCLALVGIKGDKAHLIFARSKDLAFDMGHLLRDAVTIMGGQGGGQGGGRPDFAQGGAPSTEKLEDALNFALSELSSRTPMGKRPTSG